MRARNLVGHALGLGVMAGLLLLPAAGARAATPNPLRVEAESEVQGQGIVNYGYGISYVDDGDWVRLANVDLGPCGFYQSFSALVATPYSGNLVHVRLDAVSGREVATLTTAATGGDWQSFAIETAPLTAVTGVHDIYLVFDGSPNRTNAAQGSGNGIGNFDWIQLLSNVALTTSSASCDPGDVLVDQVNQLSTQINADMAQLQTLRLQMALDRYTKLVQTLSNIMKAISDTSSAIIQNIK